MFAPIVIPDSGPSDPLFSYVKFLQNFTSDATDVKGHAVTLVNGASVSGDTLHLSSSSSQYATWADAPDLEFGSNDWCWEFQLTCNSAVNTVLISKANNANIDIGLYCYTNFSSGTLTILLPNATGTGYTRFDSPGGYLSYGVNFHLALIRHAGNFYVAKDGVRTLLGTFTVSVFDTAFAWVLGAQIAGGAVQVPFNGVIDATRFTLGHARYTADFTPPTMPFPES